MAEKKWAVFGVLVLVVLAGFIAANKFWFYPYYTVHIQSLAPYKAPDPAISAVVIKPFEGTLRKIIQPDGTGAVLPGGSSDEKVRNPFLWKDELQPKKVIQTEKQVQPVEIPRLSMIIIGDTGKTAMLDQTLVHPGDTYGGHVVEDIESEYVILSGDYGVLKISMLAKSYGAPRVDILEETNPNLLIKPVFSEQKKQRSTR